MDEIVVALFVIWLLGYIGGFVTWILIKPLFEEDES